MAKIRILRIINRLNLGGPTFNATYLSAYMPDEYETLLLSGEADESEASSEFIPMQHGVTPQYVPGMRRSIHPVKDYPAYKHIMQVIKDFKPDIVHTHAAKAGALGRLAAWRSGVPVVVHTFHGHVFHSYFSPAKTRVFLGIERFLAKKSTAIVTISPEQRRELTEDFRIAEAAKMRVIPLGFDLERFRENKSEKREQFRSQYQVKDDEVAIGIVGRLAPVKDHGLFLEGLKYVLDNTASKVRAFIVGDGETRAEVEEKARALGIAYSTEKDSLHNQPLTFTSWRRDIDVVNAGLDLVALSSKNEGTPVSLIEAQAASKPIVSTRVGGIQDVVDEGKTALLTPKGDALAFGKAMLQLVEDGAMRKDFSAAGAFVFEQFSYQRLVRDMDVLYKELLGK
ncbi:MAG: glycosyltransferase [Bacteroidia bacterium]